MCGGVACRDVKRFYCREMGAGLSVRLKLLPRAGLGAIRPPLTLNEWIPLHSEHVDSCLPVFHTHAQPRQFMVLTWGTGALHNASGGVSVLTHKPLGPLQFAQQLRMSYRVPMCRRQTRSGAQSETS